MTRMRMNRRLFLALCGLCLVASITLSGCAGTTGWDYAREPGVPVDVRTTRGEELTGTLVELDRGSLVVDIEIERGEDVEVIRRSGTDYVYVDGIVQGEAVEVRDFDIVTRARVPLKRTDELEVKTRAYIGWGSAVAGVLAFFLVQLLEEN